MLTATLAGQPLRMTLVTAMEQKEGVEMTRSVQLAMGSRLVLETEMSPRRRRVQGRPEVQEPGLLKTEEELGQEPALALEKRRRVVRVQMKLELEPIEMMGAERKGRDLGLD